MAFTILLGAATSAGVAVLAHAQQAPHVKVSPFLLAILSFWGCFIIANTLRGLVRSLFSSLSSRQIEVGFLTFFVLTLLCSVALDYMGQQISTAELPLGIVSFELAFTVERMKAIRVAWTPVQLIWVAFLQGTDHLFMLLYPTTLAMGCIYFGSGTSFAYDLAALQYVAAILDVLEGVFLHVILISPDLSLVDERIPLGAGICAAIKFLFVVAGIHYITYNCIAPYVLPARLLHHRID